jgi:hypothetical protein
MIDHLLSLAGRKDDAGLSGTEILGQAALGAFGTAFWFAVGMKVFDIKLNWMIVALGIAAVFGWVSNQKKEKKALYATACEKIINDAAIPALRTAKQVIQGYAAELEDRHNIDLIRAREIASVHQKSAVDTATQVGAVTKNVAQETAEITRNLIKDGQKLQAANAAQQVQTIDQLADRLEQQANRPIPAASASTDDRDARIAALQEEIAKAEQIKALEAKLATLKGGA